MRKLLTFLLVLVTLVTSLPEAVPTEAAFVYDAYCAYKLAERLGFKNRLDGFRGPVVTGTFYDKSELYGDASSIIDETHCVDITNENEICIIYAGYVPIWKGGIHIWLTYGNGRYPYCIDYGYYDFRDPKYSKVYKPPYGKADGKISVTTIIFKPDFIKNDTYGDDGPKYEKAHLYVAIKSRSQANQKSFVIAQRTNKKVTSISEGSPIAIKHVSWYEGVLHVERKAEGSAERTYQLQVKSGNEINEIYDIDYTCRQINKVYLTARPYSVRLRSIYKGEKSRWSEWKHYVPTPMAKVMYEEEHRPYTYPNTNISWEPVKGVKEYEIWAWKGGNSMSASKIGTTKKTSYKLLRKDLEKLLGDFDLPRFFVVAVAEINGKTVRSLKPIAPKSS